MILEDIRHTCLESVARDSTQMEEYLSGCGLVSMGTFVKTESLEGQVECSRYWGTVEEISALL